MCHVDHHNSLMQNINSWLNRTPSVKVVQSQYACEVIHRCSSHSFCVPQLGLSRLLFWDLFVIKRQLTSRVPGIYVLIHWLCKSGWAQGVWGTEAGSRGGASVGSGSEAPKSQMYTNNLQQSNALLRRFVAESVLHLSLPPKSSTLRICTNPMTQHGRGRVGTCPPVAFAPTLLF